MIARPMLAAKATDEQLRQLKWPMLLSPKIDAIRGFVANGQLLSRTLKPIRNHHTQALFGRPELNGLDGELVVGSPVDKNLMQKSTSGIMSFTGRPDVRFYVFDKWDFPGNFPKRLEAAYYQGIGFREIIHVSHRPVVSYEHMLELEEEYLRLGYEGVMLRDIRGPYKQNRSTLREQYLVKVKRFHDSEAEILSYAPLLRNGNEATTDERGYTKRSSHAENKVADDLLGTLGVRDLHTGVEFDIGSGLTLAQRQALWTHRASLLGRIVKYKHFPVGVKDKPRHPIFLGFRHRDDM